jgi:hypothetical protein
LSKLKNSENQLKKDTGLLPEKEASLLIDMLEFTI